MQIHRELSRALVENLGDSQGIWSQHQIHPVISHDDSGTIKMIIVCSKTKQPVAEMTDEGNGSLSTGIDGERAMAIRNNLGGLHGVLKTLISKLIVGDMLKTETNDQAVKRIKDKYAAKPEFSTEAKIAEIKSNFRSKNKEPRTDEQKVSAVKDKYKDYLGKSDYSAQSYHKQPTSEQFLQAASQFLGLPMTREEADKLTKVDDDSWKNSLNNFYREAQKPIEKQNNLRKDVVRGPVDQNDESQLTEEEQRIRKIPVSGGIDS